LHLSKETNFQIPAWRNEEKERNANWSSSFPKLPETDDDTSIQQLKEIGVRCNCPKEQQRYNVRFTLNVLMNKLLTKGE